MAQETRNSNTEIISAVIFASILIIGMGIYFYFAGFFDKKIALKCSELNIDSCSSEELCTTANLYWWDSKCNLIPQEQTKPSEYPDYSNFVKMRETNYLPIATNVNSWVDKDGTVQNRSYRKFIRKEGEILNAYLYVKSSVKDGQPLSKFDSIYISLQRTIGGYDYLPLLNGHLLRGKSLKVPPSNNTELLYDLNSVPLITKFTGYSEDAPFVNFSWKNLINNEGNYKRLNVNEQNTEFKLETFLSTYSTSGNIQEIGIAYECVSDKPNCKLILADK